MIHPGLNAGARRYAPTERRRRFCRESLGRVVALRSAAISIANMLDPTRLRRRYTEAHTIHHRAIFGVAE